MDQETAIEVLRERYARGGLPLEEFRRMMGTLMVTADPAECQAIIDQLPPEPGRDPALPAIRRSQPTSSTANKKIHRFSAFFGEVDRSGVLWELGPETHVSATFGEARIDVRMAKLIESSARFGEVSVPGHSVGGIAAGDEFTIGNANGDGGSYLRIEAVANFGEVRILTA